MRLALSHEWAAFALLEHRTPLRNAALSNVHYLLGWPAVTQQAFSAS